jgi:pimeloyl-ACP methyl ester carboxylesterase
MRGNNMEWDERNAVAIRYIDHAKAIDHTADEDLEYVVSSRQDDGLPLCALYTPSASETLVVSFHGSLQRSKYQLPRFEWRKTLGELDAGKLLIADTTLELNETMPLGWYIGTAQQNLSDDVAAMIRQIAADGGYNRVILAGSSGGGYASLAVSRRLPGTVAVCFSPQTRVGDYYKWVYKALIRAAFPDFASIDAVEAQFPESVNLRRLYAEQEIDNFVRYVQNSNDIRHVEAHYTPFAVARGVDPATGGVDASGRVRLVLESMQQGHQPPSRGRFLRHIRDAHEDFFGCAIGRVD